MRRAALGVLLAGLLLAPVACSQLTERGSGTVEEAADGTESDDTEAADAEAAPEGEADAEADVEAGAGADAQDGGPSPEQIAAATGTAAALPTLSAEQVELITNFQPPSKGAEDALITVYEFSDYL